MFIYAYDYYYYYSAIFYKSYKDYSIIETIIMYEYLPNNNNNGNNNNNIDNEYDKLITMTASIAGDNKEQR